MFWLKTAIYDSINHGKSYEYNILYQFFLFLNLINPDYLDLSKADFKMKKVFFKFGKSTYPNTKQKHPFSHIHTNRQNFRVRFAIVSSVESRSAMKPGFPAS